MLRLSALALVAAASAAAQPANDNPAAAVVIPAPGTVTGTNVGATLDAGEPVPSCQASTGASVWWVYTPPEDGLLAIDLTGSDFDTVLSLYQPGEIGCNDDIEFPNVASRIADVPVDGGDTVWIRVAGFDGTDGVAQGSITLALGFSTSALVTTTLPPGDTRGGPTLQRPRTVGTGDAGGCDLSPSATAVPYAARPFTVQADGAYTLTIQDGATPGYDSYLLLYRGAYDPAFPCLGLLAINDDGTPAPDDAQIAGVQLGASPGTYTLVVTGFNNDDAGAFTGDAVGPVEVLFASVPAGAVPHAAARLALAPNPSRGAARVRLDLDRPRAVTVEVLDALGRRVDVLYRGDAAGALDLRLGAALPPGVYTVRAAGEGLDVRRLVTVVR